MTDERWPDAQEIDEPAEDHLASLGGEKGDHQ